jgi:hypothetical protein
VQFALLGSLLYIGRSFLPEAGEERRPIVIAAERVAALEAELAASLGRRPAAAELRSLIEQEVNEKLLENEARRLRLDFGDRSIEQRLVLKMRALATDQSAGDAEMLRQALELGLDDDLVVSRQMREKMRLLLQQASGEAQPSKAELEEMLARRRESFLLPSTVSFTQVFVGGGDQEAVRARIGSLSPEKAAEMGDSFPLAARQDGRSQEEIARTFGQAFAAAVAALEAGEWSAPIASPFGWHLVFVHEKKEGGLPPVEAVRGQLLAMVAEERAARRLQAGLARLREQYEVEIEWP